MNYIGFLLMNDNDSDFLLDLLLIIGIICQRKYELLNNLKLLLKLFENYL